MDSREPRQGESQKASTVLVVEDDDVTPAFLLDNLAADGFRVAGASGAGEGLRAIEVRQPALVVLDLVLDDGSGLALLDRVRAADGLSSRIDPDLPVIVLSERAGDADRVRSFTRGADDHLCKPTCHLSSSRAPRLVRAGSRCGECPRADTPCRAGIYSTMR
jgi:CheY-like chemotaxis protein